MRLEWNGRNIDQIDGIYTWLNAYLHMRRIFTWFTLTIRMTAAFSYQLNWKWHGTWNGRESQWKKHSSIFVIRPCRYFFNTFHFGLQFKCELELFMCVNVLVCVCVRARLATNPTETKVMSRFVAIKMVIPLYISTINRHNWHTVHCIRCAL